MSSKEEPRPHRVIRVGPSEKWAERPIRIELREHTPAGSTGEVIRISLDEAIEIIDILTDYTRKESR